MFEIKRLFGNEPLKPSADVNATTTVFGISLVNIFSPFHDIIPLVMVW